VSGIRNNWGDVAHGHGMPYPLLAWPVLIGVALILRELRRKDWQHSKGGTTDTHLQMLFSPVEWYSVPVQCVGVVGSQNVSQRAKKKKSTLSCQCQTRLNFCHYADGLFVRTTHCNASMWL